MRSGTELIKFLTQNNSLENTDTEQIEGLKFLKQEESIESSQKSNDQIV